MLLVDDVLATGGTMAAGGKLVEQAGGQVVGCAFLVELTFLGGRSKLAPPTKRSVRSPIERASKKNRMS